jgi:protein O-mannosyl-transferase
MIITLPLVLLLLDYWPLQRFSHLKGAGRITSSWTRIVLEKSGLLVIAVFFVLISTNAMQDLQVESKSLSPHWQYDFLLFFLHYLEKIFWPVGLTVLYPYNENPQILSMVLSALILAGVSLMVFLSRKRYPFLLTGWLWFVITLLPVAGLIYGGPHRVADRYTYIPLIGLIIALTWMGAALCHKSRSRMRLTATAACLILFALSFLSYIQVGRWQSSLKLFTHAVNVYPDNWVAHNNLGDALDRDGKTMEAIDHYRTALQIRPGYANAHYNLGNTLASIGNKEEALHHFQVALTIYPEFAEAYSNAGVMLAGKKRYLEAKEHFLKALAIKPEYEDARENLNDLLPLISILEERIAALHRQLEATPENAELYNTMGLLYREGGNAEDAMKFFRQALSVNPTFAGVHNNMGILFAERGRFDQAAIHFQRAVELDPAFSGARDNLERINSLSRQQHPEK